MQTLGRYELVRPLAKGGMAEVYLARRRVAGVEKRLVIKRMRREHSRDPRFLDLFVREAQLSMALVQPNIVPVFDFGRIGDDVFLAMELIDGKDLGSTLARDRSAGLPPLLAAFVAAECCQALDHAHQLRDAATPAGVIHRDVTPRNVLVTWAGNVLLTDFGIAAVVGQAAGDSMGTPAYMAPEQARGDVVDARADVYALGIVLWEAATGVHVRPTEDRAQTVAAAKSGALPELPTTLPAELADVIGRATAAAPADRYDGARSMADALDTFLVAERARDGGPPPSRTLGEWLKARWAGATDDGDDAALGEAAVGQIVTYLEDGADGVRGSRTQRSVAETAASTGAPPASVRTPAPTRAPPLTWVLAAVAVAVAVGAAAYARQRTGDPAAAVEPPRQPAVPPAAQVDPRPLPTAAAPPTAVSEPPTAVSAPPTAVSPPVAVPAPPVAPPAAIKPAPARPGRTRTAPRATAPGAAVDTRPMLLGAVPWAHVIVDDDPTKHETPVTLELTVGPHRVTFSNPQLGISRTVTVIVPASGRAVHRETLR